MVHDAAAACESGEVLAVVVGVESAAALCELMVEVLYKSVTAVEQYAAMKAL